MDLRAGQSRPTLDKILQVLKNLLQTPEGGELYDRIEGAFRATTEFADIVDNAFVSFLERRLTEYINDPDSDPATRMVARLVIRRISPYLEEAGQQQVESGHADALREELKENLSRIARNIEIEPMPSLIDDNTGIGASGEEKAIERKDKADESPEEIDTARKAKKTLPNINLTRQRRELESLQDAIDQNLRKLLHRNTDFISNLKTLRVALDAAQGEDSEALHQVLMESIDEMLGWQDVLKGDLGYARESLKRLRADNLNIHAEIINMRKLSQMDEFTGLPNRVALVKQLGAEMMRSRRHGAPLSLALLAVDDIGKIEKSRGADLADEIIRRYVTDVFSGFRGYDTVARIGPMEFAMLLPNTPMEGAKRAIAEAQHRAGRTAFEHGERRETLPPCCCGLASFDGEEAADAMLARAEQALTEAREQGPNALVLAS